MDNELQKSPRSAPTKEDVERIDRILAIGDAFLIIEKYLIGCLVLIRACKQVILEKIKLSSGKAIGNDDKKL